MKRVAVLAVCWAVLALPGCSNGDTTGLSQNRQDQESLWAWHAEKEQVDRVVSDAINEPGGGDYAKAADAIRNSSRPPGVKQLDIGMLVVLGTIRHAKRLPPETLEKGLRMVEDSAAVSDHMSGVVAQYLRILFEHSNPEPASSFPLDRQVSACWLEVEEDRSTDSARCIALRRKRLPNIGG